jgi:hypothetical protein
MGVVVLTAPRHRLPTLAKAQINPIHRTTRAASSDANSQRMGSGSQSSARAGAGVNGGDGPREACTGTGRGVNGRSSGRHHRPRDPGFQVALIRMVQAAIPSGGASPTEQVAEAALWAIDQSARHHWSAVDGPVGGFGGTAEETRRGTKSEKSLPIRRCQVDEEASQS